MNHHDEDTRELTHGSNSAPSLANHSTRMGHHHHDHHQQQQQYRHHHSSSDGLSVGHDNASVTHASFREDNIATLNHDEEGLPGTSASRVFDPSNSASRSAADVWALNARIRMLERQLAQAGNNNTEQDQSIHETSPLEAAGDTQAVLPEKFASTNDEQVLPRLVEKSWEDFKDKCPSDDGEYAIEILMAEPEHANASEAAAQINRKSGRSHRAKTLGRPLLRTQRLDSEDSGVPARIRINSMQILNGLSAIDRSLEATGPIVMLRPYKFLVHHEGKLREHLATLLAQRNSSHTPSISSDLHNRTTPDLGLQLHQDLPSRNDSVLLDDQAKHFQCLIDFYDRYVKPVFHSLQEGTAEKVRFRDLWYLFPPGEDVYMPLKVRRRNMDFEEMSSTPEAFQGRYELVWRVCGTGSGRPNLSVSAGNYYIGRENSFKANLYYLDFDGKFYLPITHQFEIMPYEGEKSILSLEFFPLRYVKDSTQKHLLASREDKSIWMFSSMARRSTHFYYSGPTLVAHPCGCPLQKEVLHQEHVESEIIVDFRTTLLKHPSWRPSAGVLWKSPPKAAGECQDNIMVGYRKKRGKRIVRDTCPDYIYDDEAIDQIRAASFRDQETIFTPTPSDWLSNENPVPPKDNLLLTPRAFAFILRTRSFAPVWLWGLQEIKAQNTGLNNLQLRDNTVKETIRALVKTHFKEENTSQQGDSGYDIIRGKGRGLVILLHGAPGVGKTSTAECVAAANGRPLFQISCGDLGLVPREVETTLKEIFRYAQMWKCVLLLDECDVFLEQRTKNDITRNSLVSVFLRILEFYSGILFLTTNRVGVLDDAVKSRITLPVYYPPLNDEQTLRIWRGNMDLLRKRNPDIKMSKSAVLEFARVNYETNLVKKRAWNGRQIQNAFKVASALALWDAYDDNKRDSVDINDPADSRPTKRKLSPSHLETVARGIDAFEDYMRGATGFTEAESAYQKRERFDEHATGLADGSQHLLGLPSQMHAPHDHHRAASVSSFRAGETTGSYLASSTQYYGHEPISAAIPSAPMMKMSQAGNQVHSSSLVEPYSLMPAASPRYPRSPNLQASVPIHVDRCSPRPNKRRRSSNKPASQIRSAGTSGEAPVDGTAADPTRVHGRKRSRRDNFRPDQESEEDSSSSSSAEEMMKDSSRGIWLDGQDSDEDGSESTPE